MSELHIVPARLDSEAAAAITEVQRASFDEDWTPSGILTLLCQPGSFALIAYRAEVAVAFILCRIVGDECEILAIGVDRHHRRQRIAQRLLQTALATAESNGACRMILEVADDNAPARQLYLTHGFEAVGRRAGYYQRAGDAAVDALILSRRLSGASDPLSLA